MLVSILGALLDFAAVRRLMPLLLLASGCGVGLSDFGLPPYLYFDGSGDPIASAHGLVYGPGGDIGATSLSVSTLTAADPLGVIATGNTAGRPALGPDGFAVQATGSTIKAYTERLSPWYTLALPGDANDATVAIDADGATYVGGTDGHVSAFDIDGNPLWSVQHPGNLGGGRSSLDGAGRLLLLRDLDNLQVSGGNPGATAVDVATGDLLWSIDYQWPWSPLHPDGDRFFGVQYAGDPSGVRDDSLYTLFARSLEDGSVIWEQQPGMFPLAPSITGAGELIVSMNTADASAAALVKLSRDGAELWRRTSETFYGRPTILNNGHILVGCGVDLCQMSAEGLELRRFATGDFPVAFAPLAQDGFVIGNSLGVYVGWDTNSDLRTAKDGWPRYGGNNHGAGRGR